MGEKWFVTNKKADFYDISTKFNIDPVIARLIRNRDIVDEDEIRKYINPSVNNFHSPKLMKDVEKAAEIIKRKISNNEKIRIISDYDVDGVMSNYILYCGLKRIGADVDYEIPDRIADGYGINEKLIKLAYDAGIDTIVTCDNGIAAIAQIEYAKQLGMTVIVTDHHDIPYDEDENGNKKYISSIAEAIIDPKQLTCNYPCKYLCGAGVAYKLIEALYKEYKINILELYDLIQYVAIATICDIVDLKDENRDFVKLGLTMLNKTHNIGLKALIKVCGLEEKTIEAYHIGFVIGPCINATGRLESAKISMALLLELNEEVALELAERLKSLNEERKDLTAKGVEEAIEQVDTTDINNDNVLVVYMPNCHESIAGIIAGRVREKYYKPVLVVTKGEEGFLKGSARSIENYNMFEKLTECKEFLVKFGGHPMAAGFTLKEENLPSLRHRLNRLANLSQEDLLEKVKIDVVMPIDYIHFELIEQLSLLEPFGKGNEKPLFAQKNLKINSAKVMGKNRNVISIRFESETGANMDGIYFGDVNTFIENITHWYGADECDKMLNGWLNSVSLDVTYYPTINEYNGLRGLQIVIKNYAKTK